MSTTQTVQAPQFGKWRSFFWPIHNYELKKFLPMFLMSLLTLFVYTLLRNIKDSLVMTAPGSVGAEVLPFLKVGGVVPAAIVLMIIYAKLSNVLSKERLFYTTLTFFLGFFVLFTTVLYPARDYLHPTEFADKLQTWLPIGLHGLVSAIRTWTYSLFYIFSELWGSFVYTLLFFQFANDITRVTEAKRFYALFGLGANIALLAIGPTMAFITGLQKALGPESDVWQLPLNYFTGIVLTGGVLIMAIYYWMNKNVLTDPRLCDAPEQLDTSKPKAKKPKMSLIESFKFLATSKYILCIALMVLAYNMSINLIELTWKSQARLQYTDNLSYLKFAGTVTSITGMTTVFMMLFVSNNILRRFGWGVAAQITPVVLLLTGVGFFGFILFKDQLGSFVTAFGTTPLMMAVIFGTAQNIMSKASKYSLFDPTKEMAYIPLDQESKVKGKAAIDTVGSRLGKAGGSAIQLGLISIFGTLASITPYIGMILLVVILTWIWAVNFLNKSEFKKIEKKEVTE